MGFFRRKLRRSVVILTDQCNVMWWQPIPMRKDGTLPASRIHPHGSVRYFKRSTQRTYSQFKRYKAAT